HVEVVRARLPESSRPGSFAKEAALSAIIPLALGQQRSRRALLENLHDGRKIGDLRFCDKQVNMFWHDNVSHNDETVSLAHLFENREEAVAATRSLQKGQSLVAGTSNEVQVVRPVHAMPTAGRDKSHGAGSIVPPLQETQGRGTHCCGTVKK